MVEIEEEEEEEEIKELEEEVLTALEELEVEVLLAELLLLVVVVVVLELLQYMPNHWHRMLLAVTIVRRSISRLAAAVEAAARAEDPVMLAVAAVVTSAAIEAAMAEVLMATVWVPTPFRTGSVWTVGAAARTSKSSC